VRIIVIPPRRCVHRRTGGAPGARAADVRREPIQTPRPEATVTTFLLKTSRRAITWWRRSSSF